MIRLNKMTDYSVVLMTELALSGKVVASADLARKTTIPQPTVAKLLKVLAQGGLTVAHRGRAGGYGLGRSAEDISVAQIVEAVEGPLAVAACVDGTHDNCEYEQTCPMNGRWEMVNTVIRRALNEVSLAEMAIRPFATPDAFAGGASMPAAR
ncbi:MAG: SUF system Fe-S cluster assembly regulator [Rhodospirillales bacterium]|jgi:FeS assembly SUF system regulator|nr:SUF system Fe-S cluster assembly regulator [Rhodospirillales bacterium]MDP6883195.1 SUF system Fe-S cluster assembly regulator [Rhodospirillales bacterium]